MHSVTNNSLDLRSASPYFIKQIFGFIGAIAITLFLSKISYKKIIVWAAIIHGFILLLLIFTLFKGSSVMGGTRWINLGLFKFQPSELAKISLPISLIHYLFYYCSNNKILFINWFYMFVNIGITSFLIIKQPDLGTALLIIIESLTLLFIMGLPRKIIIGSIIFFILTCPLLWKNLHDYQKKRILVFLGQGSIHKERYQLEQSKIAVGSGGLIGKGFLQGTQKNLHFLPENRTDFIFSAFAEEFGFLGVSFILVIYILLFSLFFFEGKKIDNQYGFLLYQSMIFPLIISVICNIGMVVGLLPVVGIPLPAMSYGITHLWSTAIMFGVASSILSESEEE